MKYQEIVNKIDDCKDRYSNQELKIKRIEQSIQDLVVQRQVIDSNQKSEIDRKREEALQAEKLKISQPLEDELNHYEDTRNKLLCEGNNKLVDITYENYRKKYFNKFGSTDEVKEDIVLVREYVNKVTGERFREELFNRLQNKHIKLSHEELVHYSQELRTLTNMLQKLSYETKLDIAKFIDMILIKLNPCKDEADANHLKDGVLMYLGVCSLISIVLIFFASSIFICVLFILAIFNVYKNWNIYNLVLKSKLIEDNIIEIEKIANTEINNLVETNREKINTVINKKLVKLDAIIDDKKSELQEELINVQNNFIFNADKVKASYKISYSNINSQEDKLKIDLSNARKSLNIIDDELDSLRREKELARERLYDEFFPTDKVFEIKSCSFDNTFLIDNNLEPPLFWEHPKQACVFIHDDKHTVSEFVNIIAMQLLLRINLTNISLQFFDTLTVGALASLFMHEDLVIVKCFREPQEIQEGLKSLKDLLNKRIILVGNRGSLDAYNEDMIKSESVTESYIFAFFQVPLTTYLKDEESPLKLLINNGPSVGIFVHLFVTKEELIESNKGGYKLLSEVKNIYELNDVGVYKYKNKDKLLDEISNNKSHVSESKGSTF